MPKIKAPLMKNILQTRISYIEDSLNSLERFKGISFEEFYPNSANFRIAFYDLQRALEAVFDIGTHILSGIPGARPSSYKDIPRLLEKHKIIPTDFALNNLTKMAGYRSGMVHFYGEITEKEIYNTIQNKMSDFIFFCGQIEKLLKNPKNYDLTVD